MQAQNAPRAGRTAALTTLAIGLIIFGLLAYGLANMGTKSKTVQRKLGADDVFRAGDARDLAREIQKDGPVLFPDLIKQQRGTVLIVQHLGSDSQNGWFAISARPDPDNPNCTVKWKKATAEFVDPCTGDTYSSSGEGLERYSIEVKDDSVQVKLKEQLSNAG